MLHVGFYGVGLSFYWRFWRVLIDGGSRSFGLTSHHVAGFGSEAFGFLNWTLWPTSLGCRVEGLV